jgi:iron complex outermembrane receptor protein
MTDISSKRFFSDRNFSVAKSPLINMQNPQVYNSVSSKLLKVQVVTNINDPLKNATSFFFRKKNFTD